MASGVFPWVERRFAAVGDIALHANVRARVAGTPERVAGVLHGVAAAALAERVGGKWSMLEHAGHLSDLDELFMTRVAEFLAGAEVLTAADMTNQRTEDADHGARDPADVVAGFRASRARLMAMVDPLTTADFGRTALHPRLQQPMRLFDLLVFVAEHDDHHLAKLRELRGS